MELVAKIPPLRGEPGLIAYLCPKCDHAESFLIELPREEKTG